MSPLAFTALFTVCVVVAIVVWLYLIRILVQEFGLPSTEST